MDKNEVLTQLVDQAACCINMLSPADLSEAQQLEEVLDRISEAVGELGQKLGLQGDQRFHLHRILPPFTSYDDDDRGHNGENDAGDQAQQADSAQPSSPLLVPPASPALAIG